MRCRALRRTEQNVEVCRITETALVGSGRGALANWQAGKS
jgi:hypothetical protein